MIYIKINADNTVKLAGTVANQQMLDEGYIEYNGVIPEGDTFTFDNVNNVLMGSIQPSIEAKLKEIDKAYQEANVQDIDYMNTQFQADEYSQKLIVSSLSAGAVPTGFYWLDASNNKVPMTYADLQGLSSAILVRNQANFDKRTALKIQARNAKTKEELENIVWEEPTEVV